jgi:hypothetical protein
VASAFSLRRGALWSDTGNEGLKAVRIIVTCIVTSLMLAAPAMAVAAPPDHLMCSASAVERPGVTLVCEGGHWAGYLGAFGPSYFGGVVCRDYSDATCPLFVTAYMRGAVDELKTSDSVVCVLLTTDSAAHEAGYSCTEYKKFMKMTAPK